MPRPKTGLDRHPRLPARRPEVFQSLWTTVGRNIARYRSYPRLVGETGGKDFIVAHPSADPAALRTAIVRGSFEYQGQKCSAASRAYIPASVWREIGDDLVAETEALRMGDPADFRNFVCAVIDRWGFDSISGYIDRAAGRGLTAPAAATAAPKSPLRSSRSSSPTEIRTNPSGMPSAARSAGDRSTCEV